VNFTPRDLRGRVTINDLSAAYAGQIGFVSATVRPDALSTAPMRWFHPLGGAKPKSKNFAFDAFPLQVFGCFNLIFYTMQVEVVHFQGVAILKNGLV
jgi:hypothetical protein